MSRRAGSAVIAFAVLDLTAVGVELPTLRTDLGSSPSGGQWILNAWLLALAVVVLIAPRLRFDTRLAGAGALAIGAIVCATTDSTSTLVVGRAIEGAGMGALLAPVATAGPLLPGLALALGPLIGGEVAEHNWWHLYFWAGVPAAAVLAALTLRESGELARREADTRHDAVALGLVALTILLVQGEPLGLGRVVVDVIGLASVIVVSFGVVLPLPRVAVAAGGALAAVFFLLPQYLELAHLIHPLRSGVWLAACTIPGLAGGLLGSRLRGSGSPAVLVTAGAAVAALGALALGFIDADSSEALFGAGLVLTGAGFGFAAGATERAGVSDLIVSAALGGAVTLAAAGAMFQYGQAELRAESESFEHSLSRGVAQGALPLLFLAGAILAERVRARRTSSAARPAAES